MNTDRIPCDDEHIKNEKGHFYTDGTHFSFKGMRNGFKASKLSQHNRLNRPMLKRAELYSPKIVSLRNFNK